MKTEKIITRLFNKIASIENLNRGGCLWASFGVWLALKEKGIEASIVQLSLTQCFITKNERFLKGEEATPDSSRHFLLYADGYYYDSDAQYSSISEYEGGLKTLNIPIEKTESFCIGALRYGGWNDRFNLSNVKVIEKKLGILFPYTP